MVNLKYKSANQQIRVCVWKVFLLFVGDSYTGDNPPLAPPPPVEGETGEIGMSEEVGVISCPVEYLHFGGRKAEGSGSWRQKGRKG
ncbi:hypothetical protein [Okeania sp. SIO1I7]|uniref:hypothetical protein n=1 Tax=Okeania sp. SIO1I7 TaxID=2607772 RepID=UPI0013F9A8F2|nr:hypothetical protein [Okeania sp. SIO1I7]NET25055.1 hypothetical protein [Okeania sp. SIO1I7]